MLLILLAVIMRYVDISKLQQQQQQQQQQSCSNCGKIIINSNNNNNNTSIGATCASCCWQHVVDHKTTNSNSSSTSSGCDSNASSSKENFYMGGGGSVAMRQHQMQQQQQHHSITPQQLQQLRYYQHMQQQQLLLLQQQLVQRRHLQQQLREQGVIVGVESGDTNDNNNLRRTLNNKTSSATSSIALTCNQQYLMQQRLQHQQEQQQHHNYNSNHHNNNNNNNSNDNYIDFLNNVNNNENNNNNNNNNNINKIFSSVGAFFGKGPKFRRGMTEFSTSSNKNDNNNDDNIKRTHFIQQQQQQHNQLLQNSPIHQFTNSKTHKNHILKQQQQQQQQQKHFNNNNNINNKQEQEQEKHLLNSSAINNKTANINSTKANNVIVIASSSSLSSSPASVSAAATALSSISSSPATHSPLHSYKNPLNSPNNSPFAYAYHQQHQLQQHQQLQQKSNATATKLRKGYTSCNSNKFPLLPQTQYQQQLNDRLLQQQHLQQQQHQLLLISAKANANAVDATKQSSTAATAGGTATATSGLATATTLDADADDAELSEESLKQNVAIVLNNLDRYNNTLRSIILNEQVCSNSSIFCDDSLLIDDYDGKYSDNNNFLLNSNITATARNMATAATPESDYNSNATTPGSRSNNSMLPLDSNMLQQQQQQQMQQQLQQHVVGGIANNVGNGGGGCGVSNGSGGGGGGLSNVGVGGNNLNCSLASSNDFTHENSDYQWFLDYGYRDGCGGMQRSVLSSLSASYNAMGDLIYYEDLAKNIDANLAEVDMESFRAEDIHSLLSHLPAYCKSLGSANSKLQQSLLLHQQQQHQYNNMLPAMNAVQQQQFALAAAAAAASHQMMSQTSTTSTNELIDNSFCKSELLFSPVKESHISVNSLDMDEYPDDGDIILTCKANKDNYTIAFEGSVLYSDESFYAEPNEIAMKNKHNYINLHSNLEDIVQNKALEVSMSRSEQAFEPINKLQKCNTTQLQRYPSGNNNTADIITITRHLPQCSIRKSNSLPNLRNSNDTMTCSLQLQNQQEQQKEQNAQQSPQKHPNHYQQLNVSQAVSTSTMESCKSRNLLPMCQMPISISASISDRLQAEENPENQGGQQHRHKHCHHHHHHRCCCGNQHSSNASNNVASHAGPNGGAVIVNSHNSCSSGSGQQKHSHISGSASSGNSNPPAFNLVKLFIKQKSSNCSTEDAQVSTHTCMDVSSGCWPSSDAAGSSSSSSLEQRLRKKSMNDSGKGSAVSRHDEDDGVEHDADDDDDGDDDDENALRGCCEEVTPTKSTTSTNTTGHSTPKRQLRSRNDAVFYDDASSSSTSSLTATNSPAHRRRSVPLRNPQLYQLAAAATSTHTNSQQSSDASRSNSEQLTQVYLSAGTNGSSSGVTLERKKSRSCATDASRPISTASSSEMITRSMQTSCGSLSTRSSLSDRYRFVPPSFLAKLNNLGEECQAPIYVIYPNYALPDLGFVKTSTSPDVIFSPFNYKTTMANANSGSTSSLKKRCSLSSSNEDEIFKTMDYKHVTDWQSLATLLPVEYRRRLKHIPDVNNIIKDLDAELAKRPLFCMSPPIRRNRSHLCDCAQYFQQQQQQHQTEEAGNSSSGSSQQPSSGYRGSSTLLTDSELDNTDPLKQMYVYQYEQQRMEFVVETSPASAKQTPPTPMPRGILRKASSAGSRTKRNSMIEAQQTKLSKLEKRRSLQEPPYHYGLGSADELTEVFEEEADAELYAAVPDPRKERLSRKDMDARARAENFLSSLPRSELKYYAEIASILESSEQQVQYDAAALKKEVSRVLSQQKKVSFNDNDETLTQQQLALATEERQKRFSTPPNSPNISMAVGRCPATVPRRRTLEEQEQRKIESNRFKRLQIQWELMSKDSAMLKELANVDATKSGGSTPTSANAANTPKSRIPRPVSYPAGNTPERESRTPTRIPHATKSKNAVVSPQIARVSAQDAVNGKTTRSPSRIVPPKRYSVTTTPTSNASTPTSAARARTPSATTPTSATRARTPTSRGVATAPSTPKRSVQSPKTVSRVR